MVLQDLGRRLNSAIQSISAGSPIDATVSPQFHFISRASRPQSTHLPSDSFQALDTVLKGVCTALLESDVNVLLVKRCRERVKAKVLPQLEEIQNKSQGDALAGNKGKQLIHQVSRMRELRYRGGHSRVLTDF
jgi:signal recognition particle subunit SRP54